MDLFSPSRPVTFSTPTQGKVEQTITHNHRGRVECFGSFLPAQLYHKDPNITLLPGQSVKVVGCQGITLLVVPEQD
jgi:membrane protein implicated in regulation of membrane protease activity